MADSIFALSSGRPPAAIGVIRISGPAAHEAARLIAGRLPQARRASVRRLRHPASGEPLDDALMLRFDAPSSATGEDSIELHCHGGRAVVDSVVAALATVPGLREAEPGEFTRRALENGRIDLTEAEGLADLLEAETEWQRKAALALAEGALSKQISLWQERLVSLSAMAERAIDYDDVDEAIDAGLLSGCAALGGELRQWTERPRVEPLRDGVQVVLAGPPNSGKSSLINSLVGSERAIVTDIPGTTRDVIEVPLALAGVPLRLIDTAGLRNSEDPVEAIGIERARRLVAASDVLVWLGAPQDAPEHPRAILVHPKIDLPSRSQVPENAIPVSVRTSEGLPELLKTIEGFARSVLPREDSIVLNRRQAGHIEEAADALARAGATHELVLVAEELRMSRSSFDRLTGRAGVEDVLDALFSRFCLGK